MNFSFTYATGFGKNKNVISSGLVFATEREADAAGSACMDADNTNFVIDCVRVVRTDRAVNCVFTDERYLAEADRALVKPDQVRLDQV